jgi:hypothetical protein
MTPERRCRWGSRSCSSLLPEAHLVTDADGRVHAANAAARRLLPSALVDTDLAPRRRPRTAPPLLGRWGRSTTSGPERSSSPTAPTCGATGRGCRTGRCCWCGCARRIAPWRPSSASTSGSRPPTCASSAAGSRPPCTSCGRPTSASPPRTRRSSSTRAPWPTTCGPRCSPCRASRSCSPTTGTSTRPAPSTWASSSRRPSGCSRPPTACSPSPGSTVPPRGATNGPRRRMRCARCSPTSVPSSVPARSPWTSVCSRWSPSSGRRSGGCCRTCSSTASATAGPRTGRCASR